MKQTKKKVGLLSIIDNLLWAGIGALIVIVIYLDASVLMKAVYIAAIVIFAVVYMWFVYYKATNEMVIAPAQMPEKKEEKTHVNKICLLNDEHQVLKQWELTGRAGLVIGKNSENNRVDIDLSDTALAALISEEHAVLNYTGNNWYVEDFDSEQGTGVQKFLEPDINYLNKSEPVKLEIGDIIYVGKTMLQVK